MTLSAAQLDAYNTLAKAGFTFHVQRHDKESGHIQLSWSHGHHWAPALAQYELFQQDDLPCSLILLASPNIDLTSQGGRATFVLHAEAQSDAPPQQEQANQ